MAILKRERWTEADVVALPAGEHEFFERKGGQFLTGDVGSNLAKAISALANSGGGHLIVGVADNGTFEGVEPLRGPTPTRAIIEHTENMTILRIGPGRERKPHRTSTASVERLRARRRSGGRCERCGIRAIAPDLKRMCRRCADRQNALWRARNPEGNWQTFDDAHRAARADRNRIARFIATLDRRFPTA